MNVAGTGAVTQVDISSGNTGSWQTMTQQPNNYWSTTSQSGFNTPIGIRVWQGNQSIAGTVPLNNDGSPFYFKSNFS